MITFNCQHCGAALRREQSPYLTCTGCKAEIVVPPESGDLEWQTPSGTRHISCENKQVVRSRYPFPVDAPEHPLLQQFASEFAFGSVFDDADDELAALVNLRHRVRNEWFVARPSPAFLKRYGYWRANRHNSHWHCTHFARVFVMAAATLGLPARVLNVARPVDSIDQNLFGHVVVDVWSSQYQKWIYMDVLIDFHYVDGDGIPLTLLEARDRYWRHDCQDLYVSTTRNIKGCTPGTYPLFGDDLSSISEDFKTRSLNTFWPLYYHGQNYFDLPQEDRGLHLLCYDDDLNRDRQLMGNGALHFANEQMHRRTDSAIDIYPTMNNAEISLYHTIVDDAPCVLAYIDTHTPNLRQVCYRIDGGPWTPLREDAFVVPTSPDSVTIDARATNRFGRDGAISRITYSHTPRPEATP